MIAVDSVADLTNPVSLGLGGILLVLVFRTLWKQEGGWRAVLTASRDDAAAARADAATARLDAAAARTDAAAMRQAESECRSRLAQLDMKVAQIAANSSKNTRRLDKIATDEPRTDRARQGDT